MCGCDTGYTCPRCAARDDWRRDEEAERDQDARWDALYAPETPGDATDA